MDRIKIYIQIWVRVSRRKPTTQPYSLTALYRMSLVPINLGHGSGKEVFYAMDLEAIKSGRFFK